MAEQTCGKHVEGPGVMAYPCTLDRDHAGPCMADELPVSKERHRQWQAAQQAQETPEPAGEGEVIPHEPNEPLSASETLAQFQGPAQTTAERYTENPTAIPGKEAEPTKQREGDQRLPDTNEHPAIQDLVISDVQQRKQVGISRYGTPLQPFNGRDTLQDAYEEAIDLAVYLRSLRYTAEAAHGQLVEEVSAIIAKHFRAAWEAGHDTDPIAMGEEIVDHLLGSGVLTRDVE